jgi:hypothetical protein
MYENAKMIKNKIKCPLGRWWLMPIISAIQEVETRRISAGK